MEREEERREKREEGELGRAIYVALVASKWRIGDEDLRRSVEYAKRAAWMWYEEEDGEEG